VSQRQLPPNRLVEAFLQEKKLKAHPKTGEVEFMGNTYLVPEHLRGLKLILLIDPPNEFPPLVLDPTTQKHLPLQRAAIKPGDVKPVTTPDILWGAGILQTLHDNWRGQKRPVAEPGFGLPEIYTLLSQACGRHVPQTDNEAALIQRVYDTIGPLPKIPTEKAFTAIIQQLGHERAIKIYLDALVERVQNAKRKELQHV